jgi:hypothetical protein
MFMEYVIPAFLMTIRGVLARAKMTEKMAEI